MFKTTKHIENLHNHHCSCYVGITKESNKDNRADILTKLIKSSGSAALGRPPRDPIFRAFRKRHKDEIFKLFMKNLLTKKIKDNFKEIGQKEKENIIEEIKTKGQCEWYENSPKTKERKAKSKDPKVRAHKDDIYQATETLINCITYKVV